MSYKFLKILLFIFIGLIQIKLIPIFSILGAWPNIVLSFCVILLILDLEIESFYLAIIGGLVIDLFGNFKIGFNIILLFCLIYLLKLIIKKYFSSTGFILFITILFLLCFLYGLVNIIFLSQPINLQLIISSIYSTIFGAIVYLIINLKRNKDIIRIN